MNHLRLPGDPPRDLFIDAYERGRILTKDETAAQLLEWNGEPPDENSWLPAADRDIVIRMLNNLLANAAAAEDDTRLLRYLDTVLVIAPDSAAQRVQRMLLHVKNGRREAARLDARWLIAHEPQGVDTLRVRDLLESLE
jgi:regulator of sirC expression with transglutaminase-like and TPR domain